MLGSIRVQGEARALAADRRSFTRSTSTFRCPDGCCSRGNARAMPERMSLGQSEIPDLGGLEHWIIGLLVTRFDSVQGQVVDERYPAGALSIKEESDVAYSSLPDSVSSARSLEGVHDNVFFFRIRRRTQKDNGSGLTTRSASFTGDDTEPVKTIEGSVNCPAKEKYLHGFVFNRQRQDEKLSRGGEQKSLVVLSEWPFYCVFKPLIQVLGPWYFDVGTEALKQAVLDISRWPKPEFGSVMELLVGTAVLKPHFPPSYSLPSGAELSLDTFTCAATPVSPSNRSVPQGVFHNVDLYGLFKGLLPHLWTLWELLLVGEPLMVISPTPSQCSEAVAALLSLIAPFPSSLDFRPYFTIHDPVFSELDEACRKGHSMPTPPMILGITNLHILRALKMFPHVLSVGTGGAADKKNTRTTRKLSQGRFHRQVQLVKRFAPSNLLVQKEGPLCLMNEHKEGIWTSYSPVTKEDNFVLGKLLDPKPSLCLDEPTSMVNNETLRRHFVELTTRFLSPFGHYLQPRTYEAGMLSFAGPPPLPRFEASTFLESLPKGFKRQWMTLYRKFLEGPNFMPWFQRRRAVSEQEQYRLWRDACAKADIRAFLRHMSEVEIVDSFNALQRHMSIEAKALEDCGGDLSSSNSSLVQKARDDLRTMFEFLPKDLQQLVQRNPQYASLLTNSS